MAMKQRLLVMNGQRLIQREENGEWITDEVKRASDLKPGIYNIHLASKAERTTVHDGIIVHVDSEHVYQQIGKLFVRHDRRQFDKVPEIGSPAKIEYDGAHARLALPSVKRGRRLSR